MGSNCIKAIKTTDGHHYHCGNGGGFGGGTRGMDLQAAQAVLRELEAILAGLSFLRVNTLVLLIMFLVRKVEAGMVAAGMTALPT